MSDLPDWLDLSEDAHSAAELLGNAGPTILPEKATLKGYRMDKDGDFGKAYYSTDDLRRYAKGMTELADWLDRRASQPHTEDGREDA